MWDRTSKGGLIQEIHIAGGKCHQMSSPTHYEFSVETEVIPTVAEAFDVAIKAADSFTCALRATQ
jgi:hypothetical protein